MRDVEDLGAVARGIIDDNRYMALGTADETGRPWVSPVYFAPNGYRELYWLSSPDAQHSRNVAARPDVFAAVFNSQVPIGQGQAVYMTATAAELTGEELERGIEIFSTVSQSHGANAWSPEDARAAGLRLFRAAVSEHWVLDPAERPDRRTRVHP
jgi:nitroimidazol reductase NimA-like FMN-containing flavoprotein (pyridoxamine 5'-phosphate oxidase superfamily)